MKFTKYFILTLFLFSVTQLFATNVNVGLYLGENFVYKGEETELSFQVRNDSSYNADKYTATVSVKDYLNNTVFIEEIEGTDLESRKIDTLTTKLKWTPTLIGNYKLSVKLDYAYDVNPSDNEKTWDLASIYTRDTAVSVFNRLLPKFYPDLDKVWAFMPQKPLEPGDTLESFDSSELSWELDSYKYVGWVDWGKDFNFSHPGVYITIDAQDTTKVDSSRINWYPTINGEPYLENYDERLTTNDRTYGTDPETNASGSSETVTTPTTQSTTGDSICFLLVTGSESEGKEQQARQFNIDVMRNNFMNESMGERLPEGAFAELRYPSRQEILDKLEMMRGKYKCIFFYYTGHGWNGGMCTNDSSRNWLGYWDLADALNKTEAQDVKVIIDACHAGSAIERFDYWMDDDKNVTVLTACSADTLSWRYVIADDGNGEPIWGSFFTWAFAKCYGEPDADTDNNGKVSLVEAFDWVRNVNPELSGDPINTLMNPQRFVQRAVIAPPPAEPITVPDEGVTITNEGSELDGRIRFTSQTYDYDDEFSVSPQDGNVVGPGVHEYFGSDYYFNPKNVDLNFTIKFTYQPSLDVIPLEGKVGLLHRDSTDTKWSAYEDYDYFDDTKFVVGYNISKPGYWSLGAVTGNVAVDGSKELVPFNYELSQNYPNPFNPSTRIVYSLAKQQDVKLQIFDINGRLVETLVDEVQNKGLHEYHFYAQNMPSGVYFVSLQTPEFNRTRKITLLK